MIMLKGIDIGKQSPHILRFRNSEEAKQKIRNIKNKTNWDLGEGSWRPSTPNRGGRKKARPHLPLPTYTYKTDCTRGLGIFYIQRFINKKEDWRKKIEQKSKKVENHEEAYLLLHRWKVLTRSHVSGLSSYDSAPCFRVYNVSTVRTSKIIRAPRIRW